MHPAPYVLVVDDDADLRDVISDALKHAGFNVVCLSSGTAALTFLRAAQPPSLILADLHLGHDISGWSIVGECNSNERLKSTGLVVITGSHDPVRGGVAVLRKPFSVAALISIVNLHCHRAADPPASS